MKYMIIPFLLLTSMATAAPRTADQFSRTTLGRLTPDDPSKVSQGFRTSILIPSYEMNLEVRKPVGQKSPVGTSLSNAFGIFVGYAEIPVQKLGFLGGAAWWRAEQAKHLFQVVRLESNLTYGFTKQVYAKGGVNIHRYAESPIDLPMNVGLQAGLGMQFNRTIGAEFTAGYMKQTGAEKEVTYDARQTGFELGITGTF